MCGVNWAAPWGFLTEVGWDCPELWNSCCHPEFNIGLTVKSQFTGNWFFVCLSRAQNPKMQLDEIQRRLEQPVSVFGMATV